MLVCFLEGGCRGCCCWFVFWRVGGGGEGAGVGGGGGEGEGVGRGAEGHSSSDKHFTIVFVGFCVDCFC